jgi:hypothetical protein
VFAHGRRWLQRHGRVRRGQRMDSDGRRGQRARARARQWSVGGRSGAYVRACARARGLVDSELRARKGGAAAHRLRVVAALAVDAPCPCSTSAECKRRGGVTLSSALT